MRFTIDIFIYYEVNVFCKKISRNSLITISYLNEVTFNICIDLNSLFFYLET